MTCLTCYFPPIDGYLFDTCIRLLIVKKYPATEVRRLAIMNVKLAIVNAIVALLFLAEFVLVNGSLGFALVLIGGLYSVRLLLSEVRRAILLAGVLALFPNEISS